MPEIVDILQERLELPQLLERDGLKGIELGVASGDFSRRLMDTELFSEFYGVDLYGDHHNTRQYLRALKRVGLGRGYQLLRCTFKDALALFPREYFDFVYVDGYAHTGEEEGRTFFQWYNKVKVGGMIAGHDYDEQWPLVRRAVNAFADEAGLTIMRTAPTKDQGPQDRFLSWAAIKTEAREIIYPDRLKGIAKGKHSVMRMKPGQAPKRPARKPRKPAADQKTAT
ncbi:MAG: class I SAM-dependent methyltransferase [Pseudomonadota bacterium]